MFLRRVLSLALILAGIIGVFSAIRLLSLFCGSSLIIAGISLLLFPESRLRILDVFVVIFLVLFISLFAVKFVNFSIAPFEDAAMLMRYADHLAKGYGIVWNIGDKPVDGATDFLFMIVVGLLVKIGLSLELSTRAIGFISHVLTVLIIFLALRKLYLAKLILAAVSSLYLAVGPGLYYVAAYFGTPFFALSASFTWFIALMLIQNSDSHKLSFIFAISGLIMGLIRPEGVILAGLMLLSVVYYNGVSRSRVVITYFFEVFAIIGGAYFAWRWNYFGYPLPNSFYRKGGGHLYKNHLKESLLNVIILALPFLTAFILGLRSRKLLRKTICFLIPIVGFASAFILISNVMNWWRRFQYALLPIILMSWYPLVKEIRTDFKLPSWEELALQKRATLVSLVATLSLGVVGYQYIIGRARFHRDGRYDAAHILSEYSDKNYTIATTEAGMLPLYSHWRAVDTNGLNDQWIAHNGGITTQYLDKYEPQIIMFHEYFSPLVPPNPTRKGGWFEMVMILKDYAENNGYVLASVFGDSPYDTHYYYVRTDFAESQEIVDRIRAMDYYWWGSGRKAINYASLGQ